MSGKTKEDLEREKLQAEINEIHWKLKLRHRVAEWTKIALTFFTVAGTVVFGGLQWHAERQFRVTSEMITLVGQLNTETTDPHASKQRNAAMQLALFEDKAIPILIENLDVPRKELASDAIVRALQQIMVGHSSKREVLGKLVEFTDKSLARVLQPGVTPDPDIISAQVKALGVLAAAPDKKTTNERDREWRDRVSARLQGYVDLVRTHPEIDEEIKQEILDLAQRLIDELRPKQE